MATVILIKNNRQNGFKATGFYYNKISYNNFSEDYSNNDAVAKTFYNNNDLEDYSNNDAVVKILYNNNDLEGYSNNDVVAKTLYNNNGMKTDNNYSSKIHDVKIHNNSLINIIIMQGEKFYSNSDKTHKNETVTLKNINHNNHEVKQKTKINFFYTLCQ